MANDLNGKTGWLRTAASVVLFLCLSASGLWAQLTLSPPIPSQGQAGATVISINGSNFPGGSVASANITLQPTAGGPSTTTPALSVTALAGTTSRVTFLIPKSIVVTTPTPYKISITGSTTDGIFFVSINTVSLTLNPAGSVVFSPNSSKAGSSLDVNIVGNFTTFVQGATMANFGPGISVENGPLGSATLIKVTSLTTATAHIGIDTSAATGTRTVIVNTGAQKASATFNVLPQDVVPTPTDPSPPTANAGPQQLVLLGSTVHLDGSGSLSGGGGELSFAWSFISRPSGSNAG
ncbi:MAG TPA: hypothetical protein VG892_02800, partial [Terriglobales bacterium]|nr:hypothetical protein [Terriglobales bacterium]